MGEVVCVTRRRRKAPECLKKDCFLAGLYPILREKVKVKFPDTFEKAMAYAKEKDRKLKFQAQLQGIMEPPPPTQPIARAVAGTSATDQESSQQELLQQITNQLESLSINLVQGVRAPQPTPNYTFVKEASEVSPLEGRFDYIIVGGGTAGCPLAATLSSKYRVLVLERGGVPYGNANITRLENFPRTIADDRPDSPAQRFVSTDGVISSRARVLGGSSCLNAGFYSRASPEYVANLGWNGTLVNESYPWVEAVVANVPIVQQWQSGVRNGLLEVGILPYNGQTFDHIEGTKVGGSIFDADGNRHTAADLLEYANADNITVLIHANVHRVLFRTKTEHLRSFNISVLLDNPGVGAGMADNPMNAVFVPSPTPVETDLIQVVGITPFGSFIEAASGLTGYVSASSDGNDASEPYLGIMSPQIGQLATYPPGERTEERIAEAVAQLKVAVATSSQAIGGGFILEKVIGPLSNGNLRLLTANVSDNPAVTFNYFADPADLQACVQGIQTIEQVINSGSFTDFRYPQATSESLLNLTSTLPINFLPKHTNDSTSLEQFCRDTVTTIWHYHGGSQVGRVVSSTYNVLGVDALRIIDGSTWNFSPGTNPQATVMMLGRYMGVQILREREQS
ncbi:hypothetical protein L7F22_065639 [Adiantum nelumboides]|nr:hypothetical protein [Adiantum nelumboides]